MQAHVELRTRGSVGIPTAIAKTFVDLLVDGGADVVPALRQAGISPHRLSATHSCVSTAQLAELIRALWLNTNDELLGLGPHPVPLGTFRLLSSALISAPDLRSAVQRCHAFSRILPGIPTCTVEIVGPSTRIVVESVGFDDPPHIATQWSLAVAHRFLSWLIGRRITIQAAELPFQSPHDISAHEALFGTGVVFGAARAAISFDSGLLRAPIVQNNDTLRKYLHHCPERWLTPANLGTTVVDHVRAVLARGLRGDWPSSEEVSTTIGTSPQTLRRHLREQGTSLTQLKEELQRDAAIASLSAGTESVSNLSLRLGFSEPSAFHRAFRRWTGSAPGALRSRPMQQRWDDRGAEGA